MAARLRMESTNFYGRPETMGEAADVIDDLLDDPVTVVADDDS